MARKPNDQDKPVDLSLLDRLVDDDPDTAEERAATPKESLRRLHAGIRRDVESLLNAHLSPLSIPPDCPELDGSLRGYGLVDVTTGPFGGRSGRTTIRKLILSTLDTYEPRLKDVKVEILDTVDEIDPKLRFRISATLMADPAPLDIQFDSALEPITHRIELDETDRG